MERAMFPSKTFMLAFLLAIGAGSLRASEPMSPLAPAPGAREAIHAQVADGFRAAGENDLHIGVVLPLSGAFDYYGQSALTGLLTRLEAENRAGGVRGRRLAPIIIDDGGDPDKTFWAIDALTRQPERRVTVVIGPILTLCLTPRLAALVRERECILLTPSASLDHLEQDGEPWVFNVGMRGEEQAQAMARFMVGSHGARKAGVLYDRRYLSSIVMAERFAQAFADMGGEVAASLSMALPYDAESKVDYAQPHRELEEALDQLADHAIDILYMPMYAQEVNAAVMAIGRRQEAVGERSRSSFWGAPGEIAERMAEMAALRENRPAGARPLSRRLNLCGPDSWDIQSVYDGAGWRLVGSVISSALLDRYARNDSYHRFLQAMFEAGVDIPDSMLVGAHDAATLAIECLKAGWTGSAAVLALRDTERPFALATGNVRMTATGETTKTVQIRVVELLDGWPAPRYAAGGRGP